MAEFIYQELDYLYLQGQIVTVCTVNLAIPYLEAFALLWGIHQNN